LIPARVEDHRAFTEQIGGFDFVVRIVFGVEWNACEKLVSPRTQAKIVVAEESLDKPSVLSANPAFVGQASLDVAHVLPITQLLRAKFCTLPAKVPGVATSAEAFVRPVAVARPTVMSAAMPLSFASAHRSVLTALPDAGAT
jgi:hypothetical protein